MPLRSNTQGRLRKEPITLTAFIITRLFDKCNIFCYNVQSLQQKGGDSVEDLITLLIGTVVLPFIISVLANEVTHWLHKNNDK